MMKFQAIIEKIGKALLPGGVASLMVRRRLRRQHGLHLSGDREDYQILRSSFGRQCRVGTPVYIAKSRIGDYSYIEPYCRISETEVGKFCSIAAYAVIGPPNHPLDRVSTHPAFFLHSPHYGYTFGVEEWVDPSQGTSLGHDVWVGTGAMIRRGSQIGTGAVIAAGAVVTKDVPPYAIVGGLPARVIRYRFTPEMIERLLASLWWDREVKWLREHARLFTRPEAFLKALDLEPK